VAADGHTATDEAFVRLAVEKLAEAKLIENAHAKPSPQLASRARREALRRVALGAALLALVVTSLLVPTPAEAAATCIPASACTLAKYGQPCHADGGSQTECLTKICTGDGVCQ